MQPLLNLLQGQKNWKQFIKKSCRKNKINVQIAGFFTPNKAKAVYDRFFKLYQMKAQDDRTCWLQNQLKAFHWFLVVLSGLRERLIQNFTQEQWKTMNQVFLNKDESIMEYESIKLVNEKVNKNRSWSQEQTQLLTQIIKQNQNSNKWNDIARKLFQRSSHRFFRSGKQCRQRWLNHLDPHKKRGQWQQDQDKLIVNYILNYGRRWSNIAKELGNHRTQHMVKNRYKTLIIRQKKITPRVSNQNSLLREIGKRILGQDALPPKRQVVAKQQNDGNQQEQSSLISQQKEQDQKVQESKKAQQNTIKRTDVIICCSQEAKKEDPKQMKNQQPKRDFDVFEQNNLFRDPIISQVIQDCSKGVGNVSASLTTYEIQQIYSPFYINYQGITPYLSPSPSIPFFMNSSFSAFDNAFNQNLFIRPSSNNNLAERKYQNL